MKNLLGKVLVLLSVVVFSFVEIGALVSFILFFINTSTLDTIEANLGNPIYSANCAFAVITFILSFVIIVMAIYDLVISKSFKMVIFLIICDLISLTISFILLFFLSFEPSVINTSMVFGILFYSSLLLLLLGAFLSDLKKKYLK
jgi:hypothetical protein